MICTGRIRRGEAERVGGVSVDVNCTLFVHVVSKGKDKESNVGGPAPFVDVESSDVTVVVDVMRNEECCLKSVKDVARWCG